MGRQKLPVKKLRNNPPPRNRLFNCYHSSRVTKCVNLCHRTFWSKWSRLRWISTRITSWCRWIKTKKCWRITFLKRWRSKTAIWHQQWLSSTLKEFKDSSLGMALFGSNPTQISSKIVLLGLNPNKWRAIQWNWAICFQKLIIIRTRLFKRPFSYIRVQRRRISQEALRRNSQNRRWGQKKSKSVLDRVQVCHQIIQVRSSNRAGVAGRTWCTIITFLVHQWIQVLKIMVLKNDDSNP